MLTAIALFAIPFLAKLGTRAVKHGDVEGRHAVEVGTITAMEQGACWAFCSLGFRSAAALCGPAGAIVYVLTDALAVAITPERS